MTTHVPDDYNHLKSQTQMKFPDATIDVSYSPDEIIYIDVDGHRFTFEIGSDDDEYIFSDGVTTFTIPIMDFDEDF